MVHLAAITIEQFTQMEALKDKPQRTHLDDINLITTRV
jgi:hypothetical protein